MEMTLHRKRNIHMFVNVTNRELRMMGMLRNQMTMMRRIECNALDHGIYLTRILWFDFLITSLGYYHFDSIF